MRTSLLTTIVLAAALPLAGCAISIGDRIDPVPAAPRDAASLTVQFEGIETPTGTIMMSLFDNEAAHDQGGEPVRVAMAKIEGTTATASFDGLAPGDYAIKSFHDVDGDMKMGSNPFGMPTEPFAFSNNAPAQGGPPRWQAARFAVTPGTNRVSITIK
jgi:uncharacterized protein (DUF2141 family)